MKGLIPSGLLTTRGALPKKIVAELNSRRIEIVLAENVKPLRLSYELSWRTKGDEEFMRSSEWRRLKQTILERDNYTCNYCGFRSLKGMHVNHIDGNPKNNDPSNLEVICPMCHMILHSGLWCAVHRVIDCYAKSKYNQNEIIEITRRLREEGVSDGEIVKFLGLEKPMPWKQDLKYLSKLYGFITSRKPLYSRKALLTEEEQESLLKNRGNW